MGRYRLSFIKMEILEKIQTLDDAGIAKRNAGALSVLHEVYYEAFGETISAGCDGCIRKAYGRLKLLTPEKLQIMKDSKNNKYSFKDNRISIEFPFGSGNNYSNSNLTDAIAERMIETDKEYEQFFSVRKPTEDELKEQEAAKAKKAEDKKKKEEAAAKKKAEDEESKKDGQTNKPEESSPIQTAGK